MTHEIRQRIIRPATSEEKQRHQQVRQQIEVERPEREQWARVVAARHTDRVAVGPVFTSPEADVVDAIDDYGGADVSPAANTASTSTENPSSSTETACCPGS